MVNEGRMDVTIQTVWVVSLLLAPTAVLGQVEYNSQIHESTESCGQTYQIKLSPAQTKARIRHMRPISSPLLYRSVRITNAVLSLNVGIDQDGAVSCIQVLSGHPIIIGAAIDSIKTWTFQPLNVKVNGKYFLATC
jgi:hypothetical protein